MPSLTNINNEFSKNLEDKLAFLREQETQIFNPNFLFQQIEDKDIQGNVILYPFGQHTIELLVQLARYPQINIRAIADQNANDDCLDIDFPLWSLDQLINNKTKKDKILICHQSKENEIYHSLINAGLDESDLICPYQIEKSLPTLVHKSKAEIPEDIENIVCLALDNVNIVSPDILEKLYPPECSVIFHSSNISPSSYHKRGYQTLSGLDSFQVIQELSTTLKPKNLHFFGTTNSCFHALKVKLNWPHSFFCYEQYDTWCIPHTFEPPQKYAKEIFGYDYTTYQCSIEAENYLMKHANLVLGKHIYENGPLEDILPSSRYLCFYPSISPFKSLPDIDDKTIKRLSDLTLIFPANFPSLVDLDNFPTFKYSWDHQEIFAKLSHQLGVKISLVNASDNGDANSQKRFSYLIQLCKEHGFEYQGKLNLEDLMKEFANSDLGWKCNEFDFEISPQQSVNWVFPNTICNYISAGLPVIMTSDIQQMSKLVEEFNAGIVLSPSQLQNTAEKLREINIQDLRKGVAALYQEMQNHNLKCYRLIQSAQNEFHNQTS